MRKLLVIGFVEVFVKDFVAQYAKRGVVVDVLSLSDAPHVPGSRKQFNCVLPKRFNGRKLSHQALLFVRIQSALAKCDAHYDGIVIHYANYFLAPHMGSLRKRTDKLTTVVWGSDFYRASKTNGFIQKRIFNVSDKIVFTNPKTREHFGRAKHFVSPDKLRVARFGLPVLDEIDALQPRVERERAAFCAKFGLPPDKLKVFVGYSASLSHRQILVIKRLSELPADVLQRIHLVFPIGYGDPAVGGTLSAALKECGIESFTLLERFYEWADVAQLRCVTDVLVNIQPTDQFSGSMQETLYAGGAVVAGAWLPYEEIVALGASIVSIDEPEQVADAIARIVTGKWTQDPSGVQRTREYIKRVSSWSSNIPEWDDIVLSSELS